VAVGEKVSSQLGRVIELNRGEAILGALQHLVDRWNLADLSDATLGVGKDGKANFDPRGRRSTVQHFGRLKAAVKEFDNAWHDANNNVLVRSYRNLILFLIPKPFLSSEPVDISSVPEFRVKHKVLSAKLQKTGIASPRVSG
jgi:hypothetical protein